MALQEELLNEYEKVKDLTEEEIVKRQKEIEDKIYRQHAISYSDFIKRKQKWDELEQIYGSDPYFYSIFGCLDPLNSLMFIKEDEIEKVVDAYTEREITINGARNGTHARLLRRLKDKRYQELKNQNQEKKISN